MRYRLRGPRGRASRNARRRLAHTVTYLDERARVWIDRPGDFRLTGIEIPHDNRGDLNMRHVRAQGAWIFLALGLLGCQRAVPVASTAAAKPEFSAFSGANAGDERAVAGIKLCWCPPGKFTMGSPRDEPERRPGEDQVEVTLTRGFWAGKYELTQGQWKRVMGAFPGKLTAGAGDDFPVYAVNFAEAEAFCRKL